METTRLGQILAVVLKVVVMVKWYEHENVQILRQSMVEEIVHCLGTRQKFEAAMHSPAQFTEIIRRGPISVHVVKVAEMGQCHDLETVPIRSLAIKERTALR